MNLPKKNYSIEQAFHTVYSGKPNVMTPKIIDYYSSKNGNRLIELSSGKGIFSPVIYGVTVLEYNGNPYPSKSNLSMGGYEELKEAMQYIDKIS